MSQDKGGLGKGLGALLPKVILPPRAPTEERTPGADGPTRPDDESAGRRTPGGDILETPGITVAVETEPKVGKTPSQTVVRELEIGSIKPNPKQPRTTFDDRALEELAASIRHVGVLQPIIVRAMPDGSLQLIAGERRLRASLRAGRSSVPAIVRRDDDDASLLAAFVENVQRVDLNPLEEAAGYRTLIDDLDVTHDEVARRVGKSRATVTNALRLLQLAPEVQRRVADRDLSAAHARTLAALADHAQQVAAAKTIIDEGLSVRATEALVKRLGTKAPLTEHSIKVRAARDAARPQPPAGVLEAERIIGDALDTRVEIDHQASGRGRIVIVYAGIDDLTRITDAIRRR